MKLEIPLNKLACGVLSNGEGGYCAIGFYLRAIGVPDDVIAGRLAPDEIGSQIPTCASWLLGKNRRGLSSRCSEIIGRSDFIAASMNVENEPYDEDLIEIRRIFKAHDVDVEFTNVND